MVNRVDDGWCHFSADEKNYLAGRPQVMIGIVPCVCAVYSHQSAKSVYPLSIANCKENRLVNYNLFQFFIAIYFNVNLFVAFTVIA